MELTRSDMLFAARHLIKRLTGVPSFWTMGALYSYYKNGFSYLMTLQLILSLWIIIAYELSYRFHLKNRLYNLKKSLLITDIPTIAFSLFLLSYYFLYYGYNLFVGFSWLNLVILIFSFSIGLVTFRQGASYNVILSNLTQFFETDTLEVSEDEWKSFHKKWELEKNL